MKAALYARVSTLDQDCAIQVTELEAWARRQEAEIVGRVQDQVSGGRSDRIGLGSVMEMARNRVIDTVAVWKLDRFGRSTRDLLNLLEELKRYRVRFVAVSQGIDTDESSPTGRFLLQMLAAVAEFERELIRERTQAGQVRYREAFTAGQVGKKLHSRSGLDLAPHRPRRVFDRQLAVDLYTRQGLTMRAIARNLGVGLGTVQRTLQGVPKLVTVNPGRRA
jgi:DNA invertase Pin-like site-specific DNA recombinase